MRKHAQPARPCGQAGLSPAPHCRGALSERLTDYRLGGGPTSRGCSSWPPVRVLQQHPCASGGSFFASGPTPVHRAAGCAACTEFIAERNSWRSIVLRLFSHVYSPRACIIWARDLRGNNRSHHVDGQQRRKPPPPHKRAYRTRPNGRAKHGETSTASRRRTGWGNCLSCTPAVIARPPSMTDPPGGDTRFADDLPAGRRRHGRITGASRRSMTPSNGQPVLVMSDGTREAWTGSPAD
jgi:hypothetical protein